MEREATYEVTLDAFSRVQRDVSIILGAKAVEAEKVRSWILNHFVEGTYPTDLERLTQCLQIHEQQIEVIDGITKLFNGLGRNLRAILNPEPEEDAGGMMSFGNAFGPMEKDQ